MALPYDDMKACMLAALKTERPQGYERFKSIVANELAARGHPVHNTLGNDPMLHRDDLRFFREALWELIAQGVMVPGMNADNEHLPWLSVTEYGERVLADVESSPHDVDAFLQSLADRAPLDDVDARFLRQALLGFRSGLWDASAVMLGAASEHLVEILVERLAEHDEAMAKKLKALANKPALVWLKTADDYLKANRKRLPQVVRENLDTIFTGLAAAIRVARNDAGHPSVGEPVDRDRAYANLELYRILRGWVGNVLKALPLPAADAASAQILAATNHPSVAST